MADRDFADLEVALRDLGAHLDLPDPPEPADLTDTVRARLDTGAGGSRHRTLVRVAAAVLVVLLGLAVAITVSPPVRAAVLNLLRFAGIEFSTGAGAPPGPLPTAALLPGERIADLDTARARAAFPISVPPALGAPDQVRTTDEPPRVVSLLYRGGTVRLDEFDGTLDLALYKKITGNENVVWTEVAGEPAVWVDRPHEVVYIDRDGRYHEESARLSARTLVWQRGPVTLRLEGDFSLAEAVGVAESIR